MRAAVPIALVIAASACNTITQPTQMVSQPALAWRDLASRNDEQRLRDWRKTFVEAVAAARKGGHAAQVAAEGPLLDPDAAIGGPIPNGDYNCRLIKLGAKGQGMLDYVSYPAFRCRVSAEGRLQKFTKLTGSQRQVGLLFPGDAMREVFLGSLALGDEQGAMQYGQDEMRNVVGYVERIAPNRWRLIMPKPHFESQMDVMELVPA
jgi:hypothetical protein